MARPTSPSLSTHTNTKLGNCSQYSAPHPRYGICTVLPAVFLLTFKVVRVCVRQIKPIEHLPMNEHFSSRLFAREQTRAIPKAALSYFSVFKCLQRKVRVSQFAISCPFPEAIDCPHDWIYRVRSSEWGSNEKWLVTFCVCDVVGFRRTCQMIPR